MYLVVGTYERFLLGYTHSVSGDEAGFQRSFTYAAHQGAVKCLASAGSYLVSGGADDQIHLYDLKHDKDIGFLMNPGDGAVPCVDLFVPLRGQEPSHMLTGSADGSVNVWKVGGSWDHLKLMRGHKGIVNSVTVHPSGKLALSTSRDKHLRMWNLLKGRCSYTTRLDLEADVVRFSPSGQSYLLSCGSELAVHSSDQGDLRIKLGHARRVTALAYPSDDIILVGLEDGSMQLWDVRTPQVQQKVERAHDTRLRGLVPWQEGDAEPGGDGEGLLTYLCTGDSGGVVKLWDIRALTTQGKCSAVSTVASRARITCMCATGQTRKGPNLEQEEEEGHNESWAMGVGRKQVRAKEGKKVETDMPPSQPQVKKRQRPESLAAPDKKGAVSEGQRLAEAQTAVGRATRKKRRGRQEEPRGDEDELGAVRAKDTCLVSEKKFKESDGINHRPQSIGAPGAPSRQPGREVDDEDDNDETGKLGTESWLGNRKVMKRKKKILKQAGSAGQDADGHRRPGTHLDETLVPRVVTQRLPNARGGPSGAVVPGGSKRKNRQQLKPGKKQVKLAGQGK